ncbi:sugar ABC transporter permease [Streptomyces sp. NBC_00291]|uniref:sugar ABC transporter permease n=1 Tax=Streptomyces sp. NBC_00291 TaxID=2975704 RepID=UPI0022580F11|nr:sugar ABC transporter permease [Streptomyces sp. NBC_00291]MCX5157421.1 sugar ABC transporter permease [Streptomyces sp. NBC_00291]
MSTAPWADAALDGVLDRVAGTRAEVGERFPLYADPDTGRWVTTGRGAWTGGFWAGLLWLLARHTGAEEDRAAASACTARLADRVDDDTATRGLILWYGTALAGGDPVARDLRVRAARACTAAFDPELGAVPWGSAFGGPRMLLRVDGVPGMVPLLAAGGPAGERAAAAHLERHLDLCLGEGGAVIPAWHFEREAGPRRCEDPPVGWSRGRAWLLLAAADAVHRPAVPRGIRERCAAAAQLLAGGPTEAAPRLVPHDRETETEIETGAGSGAETEVGSGTAGAVPGGPLDTSAAAITAVALLKLGRAPGPRAARHRERAVAILRRLTDAHLTRADGIRPGGMLLDGCYDAGRGVATRHELIWGDFFLAVGLAELTGRVDIREP